LQVDDEFELGRPQDRQVGRPLALENAAGIDLVYIISSRLVEFPRSEGRRDRSCAGLAQTAAAMLVFTSGAAGARVIAAEETRQPLLIGLDIEADQSVAKSQAACVVELVEFLDAL
jgi:hypothetical protein